MGLSHSPNGPANTMPWSEYASPKAVLGLDRFRPLERRARDKLWLYDGSDRARPCRTELDVVNDGLGMSQF